MIESFNEFLKKSGYNEIFEKNNIGDDIPKVFTEDDFEKPDFVSDDKYIFKISSIVLKVLKRNFEKNWLVHPYIISVNGKKGSMIYSVNDRIYLILIRDGIEKEIVLFKENPLETNNSKSSLSLSTVKSNNGFSTLVDTLIGFIADMGSNVNEAFTVLKPEDIGTSVAGVGVKDIVSKIMGVGKLGKRDSDTAIPRECMVAFIKLFEKLSDKEIAQLMCEKWVNEVDDIRFNDVIKDVREELMVVQKALFTDKDGELPDLTSKTSSGVPTAFLNAQSKQVKIVHMILSACDYGMGDKGAFMRECWFWGAGKSGKILVELNSEGVYVVTETFEDMKGAIEELERNLKRVEVIAEAMLRCSQQGGGGGTLAKLEGKISTSRGFFISGISGVGKSYGIREAIRKTKAKEGVDFKYLDYSTPITLYKQMYRFNDMVLIFEETEAMLEDTSVSKMLKVGLSPDEQERQNFQSPASDAGKAKTSLGKKYNGWYDDSFLSRKERYYYDVGTVSDYDRRKMFKKIKKEIEDGEKRKSDGEGKLSPEDIVKAAMNRVEQEIPNQQETQFPAQFTFNGYVIMTTNKSTYAFATDKSLRENWAAIKSRFFTLDISPKYRVVWNWIKQKIDAEAKNPDIPDEMRLVPLKGKAQDATMENVVGFIDSIMEGAFNKNGEYYGAINLRTMSMLKKILMCEDNDRKDWEDFIKNKMHISTERTDF